MATEEEKVERVEVFRAAVRLDDYEACRRILSEKEWNVQQAVNDYEGSNSGEARSNSGKARNNDRKFPVDEEDDDMEVDSPPSTPSLGGFISGITGLIGSALSPVLGLFSPPRRPTANFGLEYEEKYSSRHPRFFSGTYEDAKRVAKESGKLLCVYIHSDDHQDISEFCEKILSNEQIITFIDTNVVLWADSLKHSDGLAAQRYLRVSFHPSLVVVNSFSSRNEVLDMIAGVTSPEQVIERLSDSVMKFSSWIDDRDRRMTERGLKQEQDMEYRRVVESDRIRREEEERARVETEMKDKKEVESLQKAVEERDKRKERVEEYKEKGPSLRDEDACSVRIRMPNGAIDGTFRMSDKARRIYEFAEVTGDLPLGTKFVLMTNFPKREIDPDKRLEEQQLNKKEQVFYKEC